MSNQSKFITDYKVKNSLKILSGTKTSSGKVSDQTAGSDQEKEKTSDSTRKVNGARKAYIKRIKVSSGNEYSYEVMFPDSDTSVWAKKVGTEIESYPKGTVKNGYLYPAQKIEVVAQQESSSTRWTISGVVDKITPIPGTTVITKEDSSIILDESNVVLENNSGTIKVADEEVLLKNEASTIEVTGEKVVIKNNNTDMSIDGQSVSLNNGSSTVEIKEEYTQISNGVTKITIYADRVEIDSPTLIFNDKEFRNVHIGCPNY